MAGISTPALKSFESLDTSELQPSLSELLKQIETLHDQACQKDPNSQDFSKIENLLQKARAAIKMAQNFIGQLVQFVVGCQTDCDKLFSQATKEHQLDSIQQAKTFLQELLKCVGNAVASIDSLDATIGEISNDSLSMVQQHSLDAQIAHKGKTAAKHVGVAVGLTAVGTILTSAAFTIVSLGIGVGVVTLVSAAAVGVGTIVTVKATKKYSQAIAKNEQLKEKYSCVSKSANKVRELIPELKTTIERVVDKIKKWSQEEEVVKNKLEELRSACEKQHPQLAITRKCLAELHMP
jgi:peptidoglycan hydrolase CwlO-like protein